MIVRASYQLNTASESNCFKCQRNHLKLRHHLRNHNLPITYSEKHNIEETEINCGTADKMKNFKELLEILQNLTKYELFNRVITNWRQINVLAVYKSHLNVGQIFGNLCLDTCFL